MSFVQMSASQQDTIFIFHATLLTALPDQDMASVAASPVFARLQGGGWEACGMELGLRERVD